MLTVYDFTGSGNGYKTWLLLSQLGVPYKRVERDILKGETRTPEFLKKNPNGRIPTLELEDGTFLFESAARAFGPAVGRRCRREISKLMDACWNSNCVPSSTPLRTGAGRVRVNYLPFPRKCSCWWNPRRHREGQS